MQSPGYLVLADTYDPGWSATVDGQPATIRPAYVAFRAVYLKEGKHTVIFRYRPAGFQSGLALSAVGLAISLLGVVLPRGRVALTPEHTSLRWFSGWRMLWFMLLAAIVVVSVGNRAPAQSRPGRPRPADDGGSTITLPGRWWDSVHCFTWGSGKSAMKVNRR